MGTHKVEKQMNKICISKEKVKTCGGLLAGGLGGSGMTKSKMVKYACVPAPSSKAEGLKRRAMEGEALDFELNELPVSYTKMEKEPISCESGMGHKFGGASGLESGHGMAPRYGGVSGRAGNENFGGLLGCIPAYGSCRQNDDCCSKRCSRFGLCHWRDGAGNGEEVMGGGYGSGLEGGAHGMGGGYGSGLEGGATGMGGGYGSGSGRVGTGMEGSIGSGLEGGANGMGGNYGVRNPPTKDWPRCAFEDQTCFCNGQVAYGTAFLPGVSPNPGWWKYKNVRGSIKCSNRAFGNDPFPNIQKECRCLKRR